MTTDRDGSRSAPRLAVVIPCFRVRAHILSVLASIGEEVDTIFVVDDACPEGSADVVEQECSDPRVRVLRHPVNQGVGAAVVSGYRAALLDGAEVVIKLDGDGQMDASLIPALVHPVLSGEADYSKGNRFHQLSDVTSMPKLRLFGNAALSFLTKLSSGYWQSFDPTNGFTAIHRAALKRLPLERLSRRYFFESDMLFQLNQARAVVCDFPMSARYADETSSLSPIRVVLPFLRGHLHNFSRRLAYSYFIRGFSLASLELVMGAVLLMFGVVFGGMSWAESLRSAQTASAGTVMLSALPVILGMQLLLSWLNFDVAAEPRIALNRLFGRD